jgi:hypothetical protein
MFHVKHSNPVIRNVRSVGEPDGNEKVTVLLGVLTLKRFLTRELNWFACVSETQPYKVRAERVQPVQ